MDFFVKILVWGGGVNKWKWVVFFSKIWCYTPPPPPTIRFGRVKKQALAGKILGRFAIILHIWLINLFISFDVLVVNKSHLK